MTMDISCLLNFIFLSQSIVADIIMSAPIARRKISREICNVNYNRNLQGLRPVPSPPPCPHFRAYTCISQINYKLSRETIAITLLLFLENKSRIERLLARQIEQNCMPTHLHVSSAHLR